MRSYLCLAVAITLCLIEGAIAFSCYQCDSVHDDDCLTVVKESKHVTKCEAGVESCMISRVAYESGMEIWRRSCANKKNPLYSKKCYKKGAHGVELKFCPCDKDLCNGELK